MAIEIKKPVLDSELDVAIGIDLPTNSKYGSLFQLNYLTIDQAVANAKNLLLTNHGERPMLPDFGCNLRGVLFENATEDLIEEIEDTIRENFQIWLPYIFINELLVEAPNTFPNRVDIKLSISLVGNQFDTRSIQFQLDGTQ
jgi:phage baseplate assembly protein W